MKFRFLPILAILLFCLASQALAGLEIKKARYGTTSGYRDVRGIVEAYLRNNNLSFLVNSRSMGGDPTPRQTDFLFIVYEVNGREYTDTIVEGSVFTFRGVANVQPARPVLNIPLLRPAAPTTSQMVIVNKSSLTGHTYSVDRYGQWVWVALVNKGQTITVTGQVGQEFIVADPSKRVLGRERIGRSTTTLWAYEPEERTPVSHARGQAAETRFDNAGYRTLYLYNVDSLGRWNWMATLEPGNGYNAASTVGETWIATDTSNRVVRQITVGPGLSRVKLN
jgi:hypothetical protein